MVNGGCPCLCLPALAAADTFIQKTKKVFQDTRSQRNMAALTADLSEVHTIMTRNIAEVLGQGEKLDSEWLGARGRRACNRLPSSSSSSRGGSSSSSSPMQRQQRLTRPVCRPAAGMTKMSSTLAMESKSYAKRAKDLHTQVCAQTGLLLLLLQVPARAGTRS